jgi:hypothetical protein
MHKGCISNNGVNQKKMEISISTKYWKRKDHKMLKKWAEVNLVFGLATIILTGIVAKWSDTTIYIVQGIIIIFSILILYSNKKYQDELYNRQKTNRKKEDRQS